MRRLAASFALLLPFAIMTPPLVAVEPVMVPRVYDPIPSPDESHTDLHKAAEKCDVGAEKTALGAFRSSQRKIEINRLDREGITPLGYAAQSGCLEIARMLLDGGAAVDLTDPHSNWTPLLRAAEGRHADVVRLLAKHGANADVVGVMGDTPWTVALRGPLVGEDRVGDRNATLLALLENGADPETAERKLREKNAELLDQLKNATGTILRLQSDLEERERLLKEIRSRVGNDAPGPN